MFGFIEQWAAEQAAALMEKRLVIPAADLPGIAEAASSHLTDGTVVTPEIVAAVDKAIITYVAGRALGAAIAKL
jgi:hypothetical protein